jgi:hypothetical protein
MQSQTLVHASMYCWFVCCACVHQATGCGAIATIPPNTQLTQFSKHHCKGQLLSPMSPQPSPRPHTTSPQTPGTNSISRWKDQWSMPPHPPPHAPHHLTVTLTSLSLPPHAPALPLQGQL